MFGFKRQYRSRKHREKVRRKLLLWTGVSLAALILLVVVLIYFATRPAFQISEIHVEGNSVVTTEEITTVVDTELEGEYLWFFPRRNSLLAPRRAIEERLRNEFKRFNMVKVSYESKEVLNVIVRERTPVALWCGEEPQVEVECDFVDNTGVIYARAPNFSGDVFLELYTDEKAGKTLSSELLKTLLDVSKGIRAIDADVESFTEREENEGVLLVAVELESGVYATSLLIDLDMEAKTIISNLFTLLQTGSGEFVGSRSISAGEIKKPHVAEYEYIDLRFGNRVYFKERAI